MRTILLVLVVFAGAARAEPTVLRGATMGTTYHIKLASPPAAVAVESLHAEVEQVLAEVDRQMSTYRPDSELSRFNRAEGGAWFPVSAAVAEVVAAAQVISEKTGGALDVTVGPLVRLWRFGPPEDAAKGRPGEFAPPSEELLSAARRRVGYRKLAVRLEPPALRKQSGGLDVDLSSIASGHAIDRLASLLESHGARDFLIELGGEIRAAGSRPDGKPWRVAIERPVAGRHAMQMSVPITNAAIATAGDYQKFFEYQGRRYSHIIDPATGRPIEHQLASVTVVADTCLAADGWDTPLLVLGPTRGLECAEEHGIAALFISHGDGDEVVAATTAWQERLDRD